VDILECEKLHLESPFRNKRCPRIFRGGKRKNGLLGQ